MHKNKKLFKLTKKYNLVGEVIMNGIGSFLNGTAKVLNGVRRAVVYAVKHPGQITATALALTARAVDAPKFTRDW